MSIRVFILLGIVCGFAATLQGQAPAPAPVQPPSAAPAPPPQALGAPPKQQAAPAPTQLFNGPQQPPQVVAPPPTVFNGEPGKAPAPANPAAPGANPPGVVIPAPGAPGAGLPGAPGALAPAPAAPGVAAVPGAPTGDLEKDYLDQMLANKTIIRTLVKGRLASLWVSAAFTELTEQDQSRLVRSSYKYLVLAADPKFKSAMTIFLSDGRRQGPKLGLYTVTPKGDHVKLLPVAVNDIPAPVDPAAFVPPAGFIPPQVVCPCLVP